jgi:nucleotide-binding universal stress UspA family protein
LTHFADAGEVQAKAMDAPADKASIVVGIDGSAKADRALGWAIEEAKLRSIPVRVVTAWHVPLAAFSAHGTVPPPAASLADDLRGVAERVAGAAASRVRDESGLAVETRVVEGDPAEVLIEAARPEDELVLGARSKRAVPVLVGSSVSVQCILHAHCPTTIIP